MVLIALVLFVASADRAAHLTGKVLDPQGLVVPLAPVELACGRVVLKSTTDSQGEFAFYHPPTTAGCRFSMRRDGFAPYTRTIEANQHHIVAILQLAAVSQSVHVAGSAPGRLLSAPIGSRVLGSDELLRISDRTEDVIRLAVLGAAGNGGAAAVYVDGLPANVLPPVEMIERLAVNAGPFSAEYGDGDLNRVEIATRSAPRRLRISPSGSLLGLGGASSLRPGARSESSGAGVRISGPLPGLPLTFSGDINVTNSTSELAIEAVVPAGAGEAGGSDHTISASSTSRSWSGSMTAYYSPGPGARVYTTYSGRRSRNSNVGVGGLVLPEAGFSNRFSSDSVHATFRTGRHSLLHEGGVTVRSLSSGLAANTTGIGISVAGTFVAGGAAVTRQESRRTAWTAKYVVRSGATRPWAAGLTMAGAAHRDLSVPNARGALEFANLDAYASGLEGAATATWHVAQGRSRVEYQNAALAPFFQKTIVETERVQLQGGVRADVQSGVGAVLSPRMWASTVWNGFTLQGGAGLFVSPVPDAVFMQTLRSNAANMSQYFDAAVAPGGPGDDVRPGSGVRAEVARDLVLPRQWMQRAAVERRIGAFVPSLEYTWARDDHRLGSDRRAAADGWIDSIDSNRAATRHRLHSRLGYEWRHQSIVGHYEWIRASDNGDGPFSYPERAGQYESEWARSTAFAPHNVTLAGWFSFPAGVSVTLTGTRQSSVPYNITTGIDEDRNGLSTERGGRPRNSGRLPGQHQVSLHASRRFAFPAFRAHWGERVFLTTGVQVENLLNRSNVTALGAVAGAATFGRPVAALDARSVRVWISVY